MKILRSIQPLEAFALPLTVCMFVAVASDVLAQNSTSNTVPVVTVQATQPFASQLNLGVFTVIRAGNTDAPVNVWYNLSGTASNGVDYAMIPPHLVAIPAGATSNTIIITPMGNSVSSLAKTVVLDLTNSPLLNPVNYEIGSPSRAVVFLESTNVSPFVSIVVPTNGETYLAPANLGLLAKASDPNGIVTNVEFFAGTNDLGHGLELVLDPPGVNGVVGPVFYFNWANVPANTYSLTAVATDNGGASTVSAVVNITVLGPGSNLPPVVRITSPPNGAVFRAPINVPIYSYAADLDGNVTTVQFFANSNSLGFGQHVSAVPPPLPPSEVQPPILIVTPTNFWVFVWTNPPPGTNVVLTAEATDNGGASSVSLPAQISILPPVPPPTNRPALVGVIASDPVAIEGTNCWPWLGLVGPSATWSNWTSASAAFRWITNCGPKDATFTVFRFGSTTSDLNVNYAIGGTATNGVDYAALPGMVLIPAGQRAASVTIVPLDDGPPDITSTVVLKIGLGTNYLVGFPPSAAAIILDSKSPRATTGILPGNLFHICASGPDGAWFHVEHSSDLVNWTPICTNQVINGSVDFVDPDAAVQSGGFYRTVPELSGSPK